MSWRTAVLVHGDMLEHELFGQQIVWWLAVGGGLLAVARGLVTGEEEAKDTNGELDKVAVEIRHLPRQVNHIFLLHTVLCMYYHQHK